MEKSSLIPENLFPEDYFTNYELYNGIYNRSYITNIERIEGMKEVHKMLFDTDKRMNYANMDYIYIYENKKIMQQKIIDEIKKNIDFTDNYIKSLNK